MNDDGTIKCEGCTAEIPIDQARLDSEGIWLCSFCYFALVEEQGKTGGSWLQGGEAE